MKTEGLASLIRYGTTPVPFTCKDIPFTIRDSLVDLRVGQDCRLFLNQEIYIIELSGADRTRAAARENALWICQFDPASATGTLLPFSPPRICALSGELPLRLPASPSEKIQRELTRHRVDTGADLFSKLALTTRLRKIVVAGQPSVAALSELDQGTLTVWFPSGEALVMRFEQTDTSAHLELVDVLSSKELWKAPCGPNVLLKLDPTARLILGGPPLTGSDRARLDVLNAPSSPIFEVWGRYTQLERERLERQVTERAAEPLRFEQCTQAGKEWKAKVRLNEQQTKAWFGIESPKEQEETRVDQSVRFKDGEDGTCTVKKIVLKGPGVADILIRPRRSTGPLPESGQLQALENTGASVELGRRRDALDILQSGRAACPRLLSVLMDPTTATPPRELPSVRALTHELDEHQSRAVQLILGCEDLVTIQGPPGTGKTKVIVEAIRQIAAASRRSRPPRVLVSSVQNEAITNVVERLSQQQAGPGHAILVRTLQSKGEDLEQEFERSDVRIAGREPTLARMDQRLGASNVATRLDWVRPTRALLNRLLAQCSSERPSLEVARTLEELAGDLHLDAVLREDARRLANQLAAPPAEQTAPVGNAPPAPTGTPPPTGDPEAVLAWWERHQHGWSSSSRAEIDSAMSLLREAVEGARTRPARFGPRIPAAHQAVLALAQRDQGPPTQRPDAPPHGQSTVTPYARASQLAARVEGFISNFERTLLASPDAILHRLRTRIREDRDAWPAIMERHGTTTAATCSMAAKTVRDDEEPFDWVIIDEAGRANPFELLIPMVRARRIVLIGDQRQLPPLVDQEHERAIEKGTSQGVDLTRETLFSVLHSRVPMHCRARLSTQYRMHELIGNTVNELFYRPYQEAIHSHFRGELAHHKQPAWGLFDDVPLVWLELPRKGNHRYQNPEERNAVIALLQRLARAPNRPSEVGVVCAYRPQLEQLGKDLSRHPELDGFARLVTIDGSQGREYPVVLVCMTRTDGSAGFLATENRMNVAISRAQRQLVILGSAAALEAGKVGRNARHIPRLIEICRNNHGFRQWTPEVQ